VRGIVNLDFADIKTVMKGMGDAMMGVGEAEGEHACVEAAQTAIQSTLLENIDIKGAKGILVNISASDNMSLFEVEQAMDIIYDAAGTNDVNVIFGVVTEENMEDKIRVTVIATGFDNEDKTKFKSSNIVERHIFGNENKKQEEVEVEEIKPKVNVLSSLAPEVDYDIPAFLRNQKD
ncbi:MAG: cell division protein FtsZ, partial [Candidatus Delongbacteria bacterium]|nr:cell division protein FtsZ [Candidatus Delongbacteria bacterium]